MCERVDTVGASFGISWLVHQLMLIERQLPDSNPIFCATEKQRVNIAHRMNGQTPYHVQDAILSLRC